MYNFYMFEIPKNSKILKVLLPILIIFFGLIFLPSIITGIKVAPFNFAIGFVIIFIFYILAKTTKPDLSVNESELTKPVVDNSGTLAVFNGISATFFFVIGIFLGVGWEVFIFGPFVIILYIVCMAVLTRSFSKYNASNLTIYTMLVLLVLSMLSIKLNMGIVTDGPGPSYFMEFVLGLYSGRVESALFGTLFWLTIIFFISATIFIDGMSRYKGGIKKSHSIFIIITALLFPVIHVGYFLHKLPEIRVIQDTQVEIEKNKEYDYEDRQFATSTESVYQTSFVDRINSRIEVSPIEAKRDNVCEYAENYMGNLLNNFEFKPQGLNILCYKKDVLTQNGGLPYATTTGFGIDIPFANLKQGDIIVVAIQMSPDSYSKFSLQGNNNTNTYIPLNEIKDFPELGTVSFQVHRKTRTVLFFYPVNINTVSKNFSIDLGNLPSADTHFNAELSELSIITNDSFVAPKWFSKNE